MGTGKCVKCKKCGCEFFIFKGVGFANKPIQSPEERKCPQCNSEEFEDTGTELFWD